MEKVMKEFNKELKPYGASSLFSACGNAPYYNATENYPVGVQTIYGWGNEANFSFQGNPAEAEGVDMYQILKRGSSWEF